MYIIEVHDKRVEKMNSEITFKFWEFMVTNIIISSVGIVTYALLHNHLHNCP